MNDEFWNDIDRLVAWLDTHQPADADRLTLRMLKLTEECGEVAEAWIGYRNGNPRKPAVPDREQVAKELGDVILAAAIALRSIGYDRRFLQAHARARLSRALQHPHPEETP